MSSLYLRLAVDNIRKNRRLYVPYVLLGCSMVTVVYLLLYLNSDPGVIAMPGAAAAASVLLVGVVVMFVFSTLFLLYTNSFLMKRRAKELGLYNTLGLSKGHILRVVFWETALCAGLAIASGLALGVLVSKLAAMAVIRLMGGVPTSEFSVMPEGLLLDAAGFAAIYLLILIRSSVNVLRVRPLELMRQTQAGERPPKGNALLAAAGVALLLCGYALALRGKGVFDALTDFFIAVPLVILGTFACFRSASVFVLTMLRRNKRYYYKQNHFVSVSGMAYRMKRNGDSLGSICILLTMVLVMMCSTACMTFGADAAMLQANPYEIEVTSTGGKLPPYGELQSVCESVLTPRGFTPTRAVYHRAVSTVALFDPREPENLRLGYETIKNTTALALIPLEDYNLMMGTDYALSPGEALAGGSLCRHLSDSVAIEDTLRYRIAERDVPLPDFYSAESLGLAGEIVLIVPDGNDLPALVERVNSTQRVPIGVDSSYAFDTGLSEAAQSDLVKTLREALSGSALSELRVSSRVEDRVSYQSLAVGFLALAILLSLAFLCATALTVYYKQITEGIEDQSRFDIMRRVGLSRRMIRSSINSQLLVMFFSPLVLSGLHMLFAFPMLNKLLSMFALNQPRLMAAMSLATFAVLSLLYAVMYAVTSRVYYRIVAGLSDAR